MYFFHNFVHVDISVRVFFFRILALSPFCERGEHHRQLSEVAVEWLSLVYMLGSVECKPTGNTAKIDVVWENRTQEPLPRKLAPQGA